MAERKSVASTLSLGVKPAHNPLASTNPLLSGVAVRVAPPKKRRKTPARDFNVRIPREATISAPEANRSEDVYNALGQALAAPLRLVGADDRTVEQRAALGAEGIKSLADWLPASPHGVERAVRHGIADLRGGPPITTDDAINLIAPGAFAKGPKYVARGYRALPEGLRGPLDRVGKRFMDYMRRAEPMVEADDVIEGAFRVRPEESFAAAPQRQPALAARPAPPALPAPPKVLALPAPGPGLPEGAAKPRGGQWWANRDFDDINTSPEEAARDAARPLMRTVWVGSPESGWHDASDTPASEWLQKALTKYYKTDFGAPNDPLRDLAARGLHYDPEMTPERWQETVNSYLLEDPIQEILLPRNPAGGMPGAGDDLRGQVMTSMPWLAKQPVTDKVYGIGRGGLDLEHFTDEFLNALNDPEAVGLPAEFAVRPESLSRMSFPQAVEHVGRINQWRAKEMERTALEAQDSPVLHAFKDYAEDNPRGLRWVEIAPPRGDAPTNYDPQEELQKALKYEGDTMGHCVGGYCPDVLSGRSRIFSLRDARGEPHVTIETQPGDPRTAFADIPRDALDQITAAAKADTDAVASPLGIEMSDPRWAKTYQLNLGLKQREWLRDNPTPEDIVQIKGKQNRAPNDEYLPFVQDFVKSGKWGNVGDLANSGLVRLPDGRYITKQQAEEGIQAMPGIGVYSYEALQNMTPGEWAANSAAFEGYAIGGRVDADRCFCHNPLSVRRGAA